MQLHEDPKKLGFYLGLSQAGMMMVVPIVVGVFLDDRLGWTPWAVSMGAVFGFVAGLFYLLRLLKKHEEEERKP